MRRQYFKNREGVHLVSAFDDRSLCGDAFEGCNSKNTDPYAEDQELDPMEEVAIGPVTCPDCIRVILHCRGVRVKAGGAR
jgi:hypothetical protein